ncbi:MAG: hypothetical protein ABIO46_00080 [Chitinophagales bacterium]
MKTIRTILFLSLLLSLLASCYKDYSFKCIAIYDVSMITLTSTNIIAFHIASRKKAEEANNTLSGHLVIRILLQA